MRRTGYAFLSGDAFHATKFRSSAASASANGSGDVRDHVHGSTYVPNGAADAPRDGIDITTDPLALSSIFPYLSDRVRCMSHVRNAGFVNVRRLGDHFWQSARDQGVTFVHGKVTGITAPVDEDLAGFTNSDTTPRYVESVAVTLTADASPITIRARCIVLAVGPQLPRFLGDLGMGGVFPLTNELHARITVRDPLGTVPLDAPFLIWDDPVEIQWPDDAKERLAEAGRIKDLLAKIGPADHIRPLSLDEAGGERCAQPITCNFY